MAANFPYARRRFVLIETASHGANASTWLAPWQGWYKIGETVGLPFRGDEALRLLLELPTAGAGNIFCFNSQFIGGRA